MIRSLRALVLTLAVPVLVVAGCSDREAPTGPAGAFAPSLGPALSQAQGGPDLAPLATFDQKPQIAIAWAKKWIGPEGGRLEFQGFAIEVPKGAVDQVTQFSIRLPVDPHASERVLAELGPHGARFHVPVWIEFPLAGTSLEGSPDPTVGWWNGSAWVSMGGAPTADGLRLRTTTDHFSDFGTMQAFGGGTLVSGG